MFGSEHVMESRWLLTANSLPEYRRRISKQKNEEEEEETNEEEERSTKIKTRRNFNIQIIRTSSRLIHEQSDDVEPKNEEEGEIPAEDNDRCTFQGTS